MWEPGNYEVTALLKKDGEWTGTSLNLTYAGKTSQFAGVWKVDEPGVYEATVYAYEPATGNTGLDRVTFIVEKAEK